MYDCAAPTESVALKAGCAYAGVFKNWQAVVVRKKPEDLLGDNINHPNEFGPWIFRVSSELGL